MDNRNGAKGQSLVEFALVLPFLLLLIIGMAEVGFAFYDYIVVASANREGVRLGSRGQFSEISVVERIVATGGVETNDDVTEPVLRTSGENPNFGVIITSIAISPTGALAIGSPVITGVVAFNGGVRPITAEDTRIDFASLSMQQDVTAKVNALRAGSDFEPLRNDIVIVETFFAHDALFPPLTQVIRLGDPLPLYFKSAMRILRSNRLD
ncbi:MAG: pilus assembly protein [Anaerolineae bacterium]|jgi:hypothetical protein|nr:pilus assembly protein [Anaerolineae bacterium]